MLALTVEFLAGRYVATAFNDREQVEWPPHPARVYSALVATWAEADPEERQGQAEAQALRWLEQQDPPEILASATEDLGERTVAPMYVPVNDVGVVSAPSTAKLYDAELALDAARTPAARAAAERKVNTERANLVSDTAKKIAPPNKYAKDAIESAASQLPHARGKQPRTFPSATPAHAEFALVWPNAAPSPDTLAALQALAARLVRVGHSSTLVAARLTTDAATILPLANTTTRFVPSEDFGELAIRWVGPGQLERLNAAHERHQAVEPRVLPSRFVRYHEQLTDEARNTETCVHRSLFDDDLIVLARFDGPRLPTASTVGVTRQLRRALMAAADQPVHEIISGHRPDGSPSPDPHLAIAALPFVAGPHPDGTILGLALALPRGVDPSARTAVVRALGRLEEQHRGTSFDDAPAFPLLLGAAGVLHLQRLAWGRDRRVTLRARTWSRASTRWGTATPIALDRNPGDLGHSDRVRREQAHANARAIISEAVVRIGLPPPIAIDVTRSPVVPGTAQVRDYPRFPIEQRRPQRLLVHARLRFAEPVRGPLIVGSGRFYGLGLLLPVLPSGAEHTS